MQNSQIKSAYKKPDYPNKSHIPLILKTALIFWGSCAFVYTNAQIFIETIATYIYIISILLICLIVLLASISILKKVPWLIIIVGCLAGILISLSSAYSFNYTQQEVKKLDQAEYIFNVETDQSSGNTYNSCNAKLIEAANIADVNIPKNTKIKLQFKDDVQEVHAGDVVKCVAKFSSPADTQTQNYWQNGIAANANVSNLTFIENNSPVGWIYKFRNCLIKTIRDLDNQFPYSESEQLLSAIVCGQRMDLQSSTLYDCFRTCGLAHLVAVSGAHLSLVTSILLIILRLLKTKKSTTIIIQSLFIFAYLICAAVPISAVRAAFMAYVAVFSYFGKRRPTSLSAIGLCIIVLIALDPATSVSISFALSAGSTLGIILFSRLIETWIIRTFVRLPSFISGALALTFAASICSQPLSISIFTQFPIISPIANIICTPLFTLLCSSGLVICVLDSILINIAPTLAQLLYLPAKWLSWLMCQTVKAMANIPYACIPATINIYIAITITVVLCIVLYTLWPAKASEPAQNLFSGAYHQVSAGSLKTNSSVEIFMPTETSKNTKWNINIFSLFRQDLKLHKVKTIIVSLTCVCIVVVIGYSKILFGTHSSEDQLIMLDVEQGDSLIIKSDKKTMMIDTGNKDNLLKTRLAENGITHLDALAITHPDDDHCGSLDVIQNMVEVDNFYFANGIQNSNDSNCKNLMSQAEKITKNIIPLKSNEVIKFGNVELTVIWPEKISDNGGNADSLCFLVKFDVDHDSIADTTALLCGDAEKEQLSTMVNKGTLGDIDIYKVGHHGSKNAITNETYNIIKPEVSLISVGAKNRYGHPSSSTLDILKNSQIFRTDKQGTITINVYKNSIDINTTM